MREILTFVGSVGLIVGIVWWLNRPDERAVVTYDAQGLSQEMPRCLSLHLFPPDDKIEKALREHFAFDPTCPWRLDVQYKNNIHCTSNQNSDRKALSTFPTGFLRLEIRHGMRLLYSYYIDLDHSAQPNDAKTGIERIKKDMKEWISK